MGHDHGHAPPTESGSRSRLVIVLAITSAVLIAEVVGAALTGSLALLADAGHMLTDVAGLVMALLAAHLVLRPATDERTWGYQRAEILAAVAQSLLLLGVGVFVLIEAVRRLLAPPDVVTTGMLVFGVVGWWGTASRWPSSPGVAGRTSTCGPPSWRSPPTPSDRRR